MLRRFFERMLAREEDVRRAEDPEDVHQMRVATRRLRATLQVLEPIFDPEQISRFRRGLRRAAAALGTVRDYDVFLAALRSFQAEQSPQAALLDRVIATVERERAKARISMFEDLQSGRYARFKHAFAIFLTTPGADLAPLPETGIPPRVRDIAGSIIWRRYEAWRAFEVLVPQASSEQLHMARIAGKRLRYVLEAFADPLGPKSATALQQLADLQEHMGLLQDGATAHMHLANLGLLDDPGAQIYLAHLTRHHEQLLSQLPALWQKVASATYRRNLFEMIIRI
jgi:CHAD domain-containing protein